MNFVKGDRVVHRLWGEGIFRKYNSILFSPVGKMALVKFDKPINIINVQVKDLEKVEVEP